MPQPPVDRYWPIARDKLGLLIAMMKYLAGDARISFEGNLSRCEFSQDLNPTYEQAPALERQTLYPREEFVVLPLEDATIRSILGVILPDNRYLKDIVHIQIEKHGELQFGSYDNFHDECIVCYLGIPTSLLDDLQSKGVIRSWTVPYEGAQRWHG
jgi:hypothetical protein